jgi:hypothetical protein
MDEFECAADEIIIDKEKPKFSKITWPNTTLFTTNPTWTGLSGRDLCPS